MSKSRSEKISKYLSRHLRHQPDAIGIKIMSGGWTSVDDLLTACTNHDFPITKEELREVVFTNDKKRFSFDATESMIRANQGHSIEVDLQLEATIPPDMLYHGTIHGALESIMQKGLVKMSRHHVHLSTDITTARKVGMRHGKPVVLEDGSAMPLAGVSPSLRTQKMGKIELRVDMGKIWNSSYNFFDFFLTCCERKRSIIIGKTYSRYNYSM